MPYELRSRSQVQQTILPEKPALSRLIVPHFTLAAPPTREGGGSEEQNAIDALKNKKRKKKSSKAWKQIQQRNYPFSGDTYILQSHENDFIPIQEVEQEEPAELFSSSEEEEENILDLEQESQEEEEEEEEEEGEEEEEQAIALHPRVVTPVNDDSDEEEFLTPSAKMPNPKTPARTKGQGLDQLLFGRLTRSQGPAPEVDEFPPERKPRKKK